MTLTKETGNHLVVQNTQPNQTKSKVTNMNEPQIKTGQNDMSTLAKDARSLVNATTDVASQKFGEARQRVVEKVESAKETVGRVRDQAVKCAKATDKAVRHNPYQAVGIAFGVGAILGFLISNLGFRSRNGD